MKKHLCGICGAGFKDSEDLVNHKKDNSLSIGHNRYIFKNKSKYFFFYDLEIISRKHDKLYNTFSVRKDCVEGEVLGRALKKSSIFPLKIIRYKLDKGNFELLGENEFDLLFSYLKENPFISKNIQSSQFMQ
jgi:hypothetical protein